MLMIPTMHFHFTERLWIISWLEASILILYWKQMHMLNLIPCGSINKVHLLKWRPSWNYLHSQGTWRYHINTCKPEFHYECDWNSAKIIVIVQKWFVWNIQSVLPLASSLLLALPKIWKVSSHKNVQYWRYVCI